MPFQLLSGAQGQDGFKMLKLKPWQVSKIEMDAYLAARTKVIVLDENTVLFESDEGGDILRKIQQIISTPEDDTSAYK